MNHDVSAYSVTLTFSGELTEKEKDNIVDTIVDSLVHTVNSGPGIVPETSFEHTVQIEVEREYSNYKIIKEL